MKSRSLLPAVAALALTLTGCQVPPPEAGPLPDEDVAAIRASSDAWVQHVESGNWAALAALYTENAAFMPPNEAIAQGRIAIQAWMEAFPRITEFSLTLDEIDGRGDLAFVRGTYSVTIHPEDAPEPIRDTGKYVEIRRKQPDSSWLLAVDIFNSDLPLPE